MKQFKTCLLTNSIKMQRADVNLNKSRIYGEQIRDKFSFFKKRFNKAVLFGWIF